MVYLTYNKKGVVTKHKTKEIAMKQAKKQAKKGEDAFVDKLTDKGAKNVAFFPKFKKKSLFKRLIRK